MSTSPTVKSIIILQQIVPGLWKVTLTWSDTSVQTMGLSTYNVQYWLDRGATLTDNTNQFVPSPNSTGQSPSVTHGTGKTVNIDTSDTTNSTDG